MRDLLSGKDLSYKQRKYEVKHIYLGGGGDGTEEVYANETIRYGCATTDDQLF